MRRYTEDNVLERTNPLVNVVESSYLEWMRMVAAAGAGSGAGGWAGSGAGAPGSGAEAGEAGA